MIFNDAFGYAKVSLGTMKTRPKSKFKASKLEKKIVASVGNFHVEKLPNTEAEQKSWLSACNMTAGNLLLIVCRYWIVATAPNWHPNQSWTNISSEWLPQPQQQASSALCSAVTASALDRCANQSEVGNDGRQFLCSMNGILDCVNQVYMFLVYTNPKFDNWKGTEMNWVSLCSFGADLLGPWGIEGLEHWK